MLPTFEKISDLVLTNNHQFVAFNKPAGLAAQTDKTTDTSLLELGSAYCKTQLYTIHRIDRPTSGLILYAKTTTAAASLSEQLRERRAEKKYLAIVAEHPPKMEDTLQHFLLRDGRKMRAEIVKAKQAGAQEAILHYRYVAGSDRYHLLEIQLETGRFHQIRAQLAAIGCSVHGDVKYGARRRNADRSIDLHAYQMALTHPGTGDAVVLVAPPPDNPLWNAFAAEIAGEAS